MTGKRWCSSYAFNFVGHDANFYNAVHDLETLAISQTVTITRLRGLIEGMKCEFDCESYVRQSECTGYGKCNCIRSKVDL